ncbi:MAG: hypothetical protein ACRCYO_04360 [Bacteroidia bacterium]
MNEQDDIFLPADFDDLSKYAPVLHGLRGRAEGFVVPEYYFEELEAFLPARIAVERGRGGEWIVPENYFNTAEELTLALTAIASAEKEAMALGLPENYFDQFPDQLMTRIVLDDVRETSGFTVPETYFENFGSNLESVLALDALKQKPEADVPANYFEQFSADLPTQLALDNLRQDEGFVVPANYFEAFSSRLMGRVGLEELASGSDADVPETYFDQLANRIEAKIAALDALQENETDVSSVASKIPVSESGKIISLVPQRSRKLAMAAAVAVFVCLGGWLMYQLTLSKQNSVAPIAKNSTPKNSVPKNLPIQALPEQLVPEIAPEQVASNIEPKIKRAPKAQKNTENFIDQIDLVDESTVAEYAAEQLLEEEVSSGLDQSMENYLLNENTDLGELIKDIK